MGSQEDAGRERRLSHLLQTNRSVTVAQVAGKFDYEAGSNVL